MIGNMIKICSLDFLNREVFETDIMTADGEVLFSSGEKITPEILLRLYFKEIYVAQPLPERARVVSMVSAAVLADMTEDAAVEVGSGVASALDEELVSEEGMITQEDSDESGKKKKKSKKGPKLVQEDEDDDSEEQEGKGPRLAKSDYSEEDEKGPKAAGDDSSSDKKAGKGPRKASMNLDSEDSIDAKSAGTTYGASDGKEEKGPKTAEFNFDDEEEEGEVIRGPKSAGLSKFEDDDEDTKASPRVKSFAMGPEIEVPQINPDELPLVFDEEQAKRIVLYSTKLGKMIGYSKEEIKELEQVAYNCNIGIGKFKRADANKKGFRKMKAFASYEKLIEDGIVPSYLAEMIKYIVNSYESDSFPLDSKIPYYHIVAITSFYEDLLAQGMPKPEILLKMLQLGGHKFNIFVLHKFIKMMRDEND